VAPARRWSPGDFASRSLAVGMDIDLEALRLGTTLTDRVKFVLASGEQLPFADGRFDFVYSRVALPYMNLKPALAEIARVTCHVGDLASRLHGLGRSMAACSRRTNQGSAV
jgi:ubiquinone/menaquinone biosynthesis C-methylase UbiE